MDIRRRLMALFAAALLVLATATGALAADARPDAPKVLRNWYGLMLELVRHTATYSPPVASRAFGYLGVAAYEAAVGGSDRLVSLVGQLNGLEAVPGREPGLAYDEAVIAHAVMATMVRSFFGNTGPTGQRAVAAADRKWGAEVAAGVPPDVLERSTAFGTLMADSIIEWSKGDGGAEIIVNMGFPLDYELPRGEDKWVPTSTIAQQQSPLLPEWGNNRTFAAPNGATCAASAAARLQHRPGICSSTRKPTRSTRRASPSHRNSAPSQGSGPMIRC
jgi:hypothetical protein